MHYEAECGFGSSGGCDDQSAGMPSIPEPPEPTQVWPGLQPLLDEIAKHPELKNDPRLQQNLQLLDYLGRSNQKYNQRLAEISEERDKSPDRAGILKKEEDQLARQRQQNNVVAGEAVEDIGKILDVSIGPIPEFKE